ncbi:hypothetical protein Aspvir_005679 [Aspergillus viridinutans]|uniref:Uncharacterized protein n=1 Tax=Aspergillus viridinutans TaxID=75553 RepID=A0A9P3BXZ3_ASPVI|nr:uncharacterized protein Aspvir_005679 [Aspergillus viridinutans]GIK01641.1 hypothetical protein Aspvir_005679 [Aspergillus viridinutans]
MFWRKYQLISLSCLATLGQSFPASVGNGVAAAGGVVAPVGELPDHASCNDLSHYQFLNGGGLKSSYWDQIRAGDYLQHWINNNLDSSHTNLGPAFAEPWGLGQSFVCTMTTFCPRPNCANLQNPNAVDSARAYQILYLYYLRQAIDVSQTRWNGLQVALQGTFWPGLLPDDMMAHDFLNGIMTAVGIVAAIVGGPAIISGKELVNGWARGVDKRVKASDQSLANLAKMEASAAAFYQGAINETVTLNDGLMFQGSYNGKSIVDVLADGAWLDYHKIPVLNQDTSLPRISETQASDHFYNMLLCFSINYAWKQQNVYLISYPMTQDEFDNLSVISGDNDARLKHYYGGRGFFFQSLIIKPDLLVHGDYPHPQNPPGWKEIENNGFSTWDIIQSSASAFTHGGFDYQFDNDLESYLDSQDWSTLLSPPASLPGVFTIPHCQVMPNDDAKNIQAFADWLDGPKTNLLNKKSSFCLCKDIQDKNGKKFSDYVVGAQDILRHCLENDFPGVKNVFLAVGHSKGSSG